MVDLALEGVAVEAAGRHRELAAGAVEAVAALDGREGHLLTRDVGHPADGDGLGEEVAHEAADGDVALAVIEAGDQRVGGGGGGGDCGSRRRTPKFRWRPEDRPPPPAGGGPPPKGDVKATPRRRAPGDLVARQGGKFTRAKSFLPTPFLTPKKPTPTSRRRTEVSHPPARPRPRNISARGVGCAAPLPSSHFGFFYSFWDLLMVRRCWGGGWSGEDTGLLLLSGAGGKRWLDWLKIGVFLPKIEAEPHKNGKNLRFLEEVEVEHH